MNKGLLKGIIKTELSKKGYKIKNTNMNIEDNAVEILKDKYVTKKEINDLRNCISNCIDRYIEKAYISWRDMHFRLEGDCTFETFLGSRYFGKCKNIDVYVKNYRDKRIKSDVLFIIDNFTDYSCLMMPTL